MVANYIESDLGQSAKRLNEKLVGRHILSIKQFDLSDLEAIAVSARAMRSIRSIVGGTDWLKHKHLANLFYEPSTRTMKSFEAAMHRHGGTVGEISEVHYSSVAKGENLPDTVRTLQEYADIIVLRHPETGAAKEAAGFLKRSPLINAGDGQGEHPTQALLDYVTIRERHKNIDGLVVTMLGDLRYGRTVHSLARLLALYNISLNLVAPDVVQMPPEIVDELKTKPRVRITQSSDLAKFIEQADVLYVTRIQKERFEKPEEYESVKDAYVVTPETIKKARPGLILMHPLPRVGEIDPIVDADPRAIYFDQMGWGLDTRMVLLAAVLGKLPEK